MCCNINIKAEKVHFVQTDAHLGNQSSKADGKHELKDRHQFGMLACEDTSTSLPISDVQLVGVCAFVEAGMISSNMIRRRVGPGD